MLKEEGLRRIGGLKEALTLLSSSIVDLEVLVLSFMGFTAFFVRIGVFTYLSDILTLPPYEYGNDVIAGYLSLSGLGGLLAGEIAGYLTDKVGRWRTALMGFATLALVLAAFMSDHWIDYLAILLLFQGIFSTTATTALNTMIMEVDPARRATASPISRP